MKPLLLSSLLSLALLGAACSRRPAPVPRPQAYPRIEILPADYRPEGLIQVNQAALVSPGLKPGHINILYPTYRAGIFCTITDEDSPERLRAAIANRMERMELTSGSAYGELTSLTSRSGLHAIMLTTPRELLTPVQFLATDSIGLMVSGYGGFQGPVSDPDSVAPIVKMIERDVLYLLKEL